MVTYGTMPQPAPRVFADRAGEVVLRTNAISKQYGKKLVVNNLNLAVYRGDIFGFLGPNGAGKTTTIRMALGLVTPTNGHIEILGQDITHAGPEHLARVGALVETPALYLYMSGHDNLIAVGKALGGIPEARIQTILQQVGLAQRQKDRVKTYSLGMKQRLGVAMALLNDPDMLILDEPANGLDPAGIVEMRDLMRILAAQGKTIFISSHVLAEVQQICTRVAILNLGNLVTEATVEDLTRGAGQGGYSVYVERAPEALAAIQAQPWGVHARLDPNGSITTPAPDGRGRSLNEFLMKQGFIADGIVYQQESLEQVFLRLTQAPAGGAR